MAVPKRKPKKKRPKLKLIVGGKGKPKIKVQPARKRGRPPENKVLWRAVLRLPKKTADRLKRAIKHHNKDRDVEDQLSINTTIETIIGVWLEEEGF